MPPGRPMPVRPRLPVVVDNLCQQYMWICTSRLTPWAARERPFGTQAETALSGQDPTDGFYPKASCYPSVSTGLALCASVWVTCSSAVSSVRVAASRPMDCT